MVSTRVWLLRLVGILAVGLLVASSMEPKLRDPNKAGALFQAPDPVASRYGKFAGVFLLAAFLLSDLRRSKESPTEKGTRL